MPHRELTEQEKKIYENSLKRQEAEQRSLAFRLKFNKLMLEEGNFHNYLERQKQTKMLIEEDEIALQACESAISDCKDKLENGVESKESEE